MYSNQGFIYPCFHSETSPVRLMDSGSTEMSTIHQGKADIPTRNRRPNDGYFNEVTYTCLITRSGATQTAGGIGITLMLF